ncbi:MAG: dienelactone hydrolase family protein [Kofleriaceae bacterium]
MRLFAFLMLVACSSPANPAKPESHRPSDTGAVTEAKFKAMHAPPTAGPAVRNGQAVDLNGTKAYLSLPSGTGPFPAIVVIHEWWGLNANIEHWADRLASAGWAALAVDLYGGVVTADPDVAMKTMKAVDDAKAAKVIADGLAFVKTDPRIQATARAVIGWCFGGGWALQAALAHPELDGAIMYYGQLETDPAKLSAIKARLLGVFGTRDEGLPQASLDAFEAALKQANVRAEVKRYDAEHGFANPSNPIYDQTSAGDAWTHVLALLREITK